MISLCGGEGWHYIFWGANLLLFGQKSYMRLLGAVW